VPLGTAGETTYANPTITVPVSVERDFYGRNVVQVSGPIASQSGAEFVGAGQLVPVPTGRTDAAAASAGTSAATPVQMDFLTGRQSTDLGHSVPNRPIQTGTEGLVFTTTAPMVSVGTGASVGVWHPASTPVDTSGPGVAGFALHAVLSLVNGGYGSPAFRGVVPSASGGAIPIAGFLDSAAASRGVAGLARGTCPTIGSHVPAPLGGGAPPPGGPGAETDTVFSSRVVKSEEGHIWVLVQRRLAELGYPDREGPNGRYLPSLAISAVPPDGLAPASVKPVTRDLRPTSKDIFSRAYVNCEFHGRPLACMLDTGCDRSVIGRRFVKSRDLQPVRLSLMGAGRKSLKVDGETSIQFSIDGHPMEAEVSVLPSIDELLLGCDWLTRHKGRWDFATGVVQLGNIEVQTRPKRAPEIACRRLVVAERFTVPACHEANIPVRMETDWEPQPTVEWAVES